MPIPKNILSVPRPLNTVVEDSGVEGLKRYYVRARKGRAEFKNGGTYPLNGKTIGYIYKGKYIAKSELIKPERPPYLSYGSSALVEKHSKDLFLLLTECFDIKVAGQIMAVAHLKIIINHIGSNRYSTHYKTCFTSLYYENLPLSKNVITSLYEKVGNDINARKMFFDLRIKSVQETHNLIIDGTLRQDNSSINNFSASSRKSRQKGVKHHSILYAYDTVTGEPIVSQVYPGNMLDLKCLDSFVNDNNINTGTVIVDKGFSVEGVKKLCKKYKTLHFIVPLRNNNTKIIKYNMLKFTSSFIHMEEFIYCKKSKTYQGTYLYSFQNLGMKEQQTKTVFRKCNNTDNQEDFEKHYDKLEYCGAIVFESDLDITPEELYKAYDLRWLLELVFDRYKNDLYFNTTNVQGNSAVVGEEFVNLVATTITTRILKEIDDKGITKKMSFSDMMYDLGRCMRCNYNIDELPDIDDSGWVYQLDKSKDLLVQLGLATNINYVPPRKRGRKPKNKN